MQIHETGHESPKIIMYISFTLIMLVRSSASDKFLIQNFFFFLYFILSSTEIIKFTRKAKARGLNGLVSIIIIEDC